MDRPEIHRPDPNVATAQELVDVSGISFEEAEAIVRYREQHGPIRTWEDLRKILDEVGTDMSDEHNATVTSGPQSSTSVDSAEADVRTSPVR